MHVGVPPVGSEALSFAGKPRVSRHASEKLEKHNVNAHPVINQDRRLVSSS
jgi:CBS-domain-containing membrane protein